jgi:hypothetical protein
MTQYLKSIEGLVLIGEDNFEVEEYEHLLK